MPGWSPGVDNFQGGKDFWFLKFSIIKNKECNFFLPCWNRRGLGVSKGGSKNWKFRCFYHENTQKKAHKCATFFVFLPRWNWWGNPPFPPVAMRLPPSFLPPLFCQNGARRGGGNFPVWAKISNSEIFYYKKKKRVIFILSCWIQGKGNFPRGGAIISNSKRYPVINFWIPFSPSMEPGGNGLPQLATLL